MVAVQEEGNRLRIDVVVVQPPADCLQLFLAVVDGDADAVVAPLQLQTLDDLQLIDGGHVSSKLCAFGEGTREANTPGAVVPSVPSKLRTYSTWYPLLRATRASSLSVAIRILLM